MRKGGSSEDGPNFIQWDKECRWRWGRRKIKVLSFRRRKEGWIIWILIIIATTKTNIPWQDIFVGIFWFFFFFFKWCNFFLYFIIYILIFLRTARCHPSFLPNCIHDKTSFSVFFKSNAIGFFFIQIPYLLFITSMFIFIF